MTTAREQFDYDTWRAEQKAKRAAKIAAAVERLDSYGDPVLPSGTTVRVDAYITPLNDMEDWLASRARLIPIPKSGYQQIVLDMTLATEGVWYQHDIDRYEDGKYIETLGLAVLDSVYTITSNRTQTRIIAIYNIGPRDNEYEDDMRPLNHL